MSDPLGRIESLYHATLAVGARIGVYEIVALIGAGGMGEVYRAHDSKLGRDVAIKVLPQSFVADPDRQARFEREARLLAALNHPNIAHVHGLEDSGGVLALVMELVEGDTLADRIARGPIPLPEALPIARQIAEALAAAHEQGIIHRDLKPANVKVRPDGSVKVLDFGLAKWTEPAAAVDVMNSPTLSARSTQQGLILGTAAYMSPEQAAGQRVDRRTDLWSFGAVLFEMLTGRRVFDGETVSHVIAAVLKTEPEWSALPRETPISLRTLLRHCLAKDPKQRLDSAAAAVLVLQDVAHASIGGMDATQARGRSDPRWYLVVAATAVTVAIVATLVQRAIIGSTHGDPAPVVYASIGVPDSSVLGDDDLYVSLPLHTPMVFLPDGRSLVILVARDGKRQLFLRSLDQRDARPIVGTDGARVPFVSPDGKWVGFFANGELRKVPAAGGEAATICAIPKNFGPHGVTWGPNDLILFADDSTRRIMRVSAQGGVAAPVTAVPSLPKEHVTPYFLPDGKRFLFAETSRVDLEDSRLMIQDLDGNEARLVIPNATDGRMLPTGRLAFMRLGSLMTVGFDMARGVVTGDAVMASRDVMQSGLRARAAANNTGAGMFAVSSLGTLAVIRGPVAGGEGNQLVWTTRDGRSTSAEPSSGAPSGARLVPRVSPDGTRFAVTVITPTRWEVWFGDWTRDTWTACLECGAAGTQRLPKAWSPDGRRLLVEANRETLVEHTIDRSAPDRVLVSEPNRVLYPGEWLQGDLVVYGSNGIQASPPISDIKLISPGASAGRVIASGTRPTVSPDGRWIAYTSDDSGNLNIFVQTFPIGPRVQVSAGSGYDAAWSPDGRTLYYTQQKSHADYYMIAVDISRSAAGGPVAGVPRQVFQHASNPCAQVRCFDIAPDGRFLLRDPKERQRVSVTQMDLILNWTSTLPK